MRGQAVDWTHRAEGKGTERLPVTVDLQVNAALCQIFFSQTKEELFNDQILSAFISRSQAYTGESLAMSSICSAGFKGCKVSGRCAGHLRVSSR